MLTVLNDLHIGVQRSSGTTPLTQWKLRQSVIAQADELIMEVETDLMILGDLFDTHAPSREVWEPLARKLQKRAWQGRPVFLLPGNPVSCLCAYDFFAGRAIRLRGGRPPDWPHRTRECVVARKIVSAIGRVDYCRVRLVDDRVEPIALSGASILSSTTRADGFVIVPGESEGYGPGTEVTVYLSD